MGKRVLKSRLARRMTPATVNVVEKGVSGSSVTETTIYDDIEAAYIQKVVKEGTDGFGGVSSRVADLFYFERINGALPAIEEKHIIQWNGIDYEITQALNLGGLGERLEVVTERIR